MIIQPVNFSDRAELIGVAVKTGIFSPTEAEALLGSILDQLAEGILPDGHAALSCRTHSGGVVTGWTYFAPDQYAEGVLNVWWLGVSPEEQGTGVGTALLRAAESLALDNGARIVVIETSSKEPQARARGFYLRQGYAECGRVPDFYGDGDHKVIFSRRPRQAERSNQPVQR